MKCTACYGNGEQISYFPNPNGPTQVSCTIKCHVCNGSGKMSMKDLRQQLDGWKDSAFKVLLVLLDLRRDHMSLQDINKCIALEIELNKIVDMAMRLAEVSNEKHDTTT